MAAREALRLTTRTQDPLRAAATRSTLGHVLIRQGRFVDAERVYVATAKSMQPEGDASIAHLSVYGGILLAGATAARQGRAGAATELLAETTAVAERTGVDRTDYEVVFGPNCVVMQSVDCSVVTEDYVRAAEVARTMPLVSRSRHLLDVADTQLRLGHDRVAESTLLAMESSPPPPLGFAPSATPTEGNLRLVHHQLTSVATLLCQARFPHAAVANRLLVEWSQLSQVAGWPTTRASTGCPMRVAWSVLELAYAVELNGEFFGTSLALFPQHG
ncbi:MAG: hypothetical protein ACRDQ4_16935 [Pseudonocardiaceae bacterium]